MAKKELFSGLSVVFIFALAATLIAATPFFSDLAISPLIIGIVLGMVYANFMQPLHNPKFQSGIIFSTKTLLRVAIVFYGFRLSFQNIYELGFSVVLLSAFIVFSTFIIGYLVGVKLLKLDKDTAILTSAGSSICGAAAVLATESAIKAKPYKSAVAVSTVVVFGTVAMFLYPFLYRLGIFDLTTDAMGIYIGATLHEVANVVAAGNAVTEEAADSAVIVKMIRVMMLAPFLLLLSYWFFKKSTTAKNTKTKIALPWFAVLFIVVIAINSFGFLSQDVIFTINTVDTFALTMAMTALGMETKKEKFTKVGLKPLYLAAILFVWLLFGGYLALELIVL